MSLPVVIVQSRRKALGYEQVTALSAAVHLASRGAALALIQAETKDVRWRDDGVAPTATVGMLLAAGASFVYDGDLDAVQFIETAASAKLNINYLGAEGS